MIPARAVATALFDDPISHRGNGQHPGIVVGVGDLHPLQRPWSVSAVAQFGDERSQFGFCDGGEACDAAPDRLVGASVGLNLGPRLTQRLDGGDLVEQEAHRGDQVGSNRVTPKPRVV